MKLAKVFFGLIVIAIFTLFATANLDEVTVRLFSRDVINTQVFMLIYASFALGFVVAWFLGSQMIRLHKKKWKKLQKQYDLLVKERDELRNLPVNSASESNLLPEDNENK